MSKIVVGHKSLNLEELYNVSCVGSVHGIEVVVDSQIYAELNTLAVKDGNSSFTHLQDISSCSNDVIKFSEQ